MTNLLRGLLATTCLSTLGLSPAYAATVIKEIEPNDTFDTAQLIDTGGLPVSVSGSNSGSANIDRHVNVNIFDLRGLPPNHQFHLVVDAPDAPTEFIFGGALHSFNPPDLGWGFIGGGHTSGEATGRIPATGQMYAALWRYDGGSGPYSFTLNYTDPLPTPTPTPVILLGSAVAGLGALAARRRQTSGR